MADLIKYTDPRPGLPVAFDRVAGDRLIDQCNEKYPEFSTRLTSEQIDFLHAVGGCSPYLSRLMVRHPAWLLDILQDDLEVCVGHACGIADEAASAGKDKFYTEQKKILRQAKDYAALSIALHDLGMRCSVMMAASALSQFADHAVRVAFSCAFDGAIERGEIGGDVQTSGITILAMGKHGGQELNYSSDIDLIAFYDPEAMTVEDAAQAKPTAVKIIRDMVNILSEQTVDGYVFRTDLRLRPDPGVSAVAMSVAAAEHYYEAHGQNWERAAFIKARPVAGDIDLGYEFLQRLRPFIWRKFLDYAAIEDLQAIHRKIIATHASYDDGFADYNLKLGPGGIREIEFTAQIHQLIAGGKNPELRCQNNLGALHCLQEHRLLSSHQARNLSDAYIALRFLEHRVQMVHDEQCHTIPKRQDDIERLACLCGFVKIELLKVMVQTVTRQTAHGHQGMFQSKEAEDVDDGFDFTGVDNNPETLAQLQALGFQRADNIVGIIRRWYAGESRATRTERARGILVKVIPSLLEALAKASDPDEAFVSFDRFLNELPSGIQIFSLFANQRQLFDILIRILVLSPRLGRELSRHRGFLEALGGGGWLSSQASGQSLMGSLNTELDTQLRGSLFEDVMNQTRRLIGEARFMTATGLVIHQASIDETGGTFAEIAESAIAALDPAADLLMRDQYGDIDGALCVVGFGRLGAGRMTFSSDIDIVFVYDVHEDVCSDGEKSLDGVTWFTRKVRRMVTALSAATEEGYLYEVDMQLRPSGGAGPAAVKWSAFQSYYDRDAWIWEMMALTKARVVHGPPVLKQKIEDFIRDALCRPRDAGNVAREVHAMRERLLAEKAAKSVWDRKAVLGGLTDIEFVFQFLTLVMAHDHGLPPRDVKGMCKWFVSHEFLTLQQAEALQQAFQLNEAILQYARLGNGPCFDPQRDGTALTARMLEICAVSTVEDAVTRLEMSSKTVKAIYDDIIVTPYG